MNKIYTKRGDKGWTTCLSGKVAHKGSTLILCIGALDELHAWISYVISLCPSATLSSKELELVDICTDLSSIMDYISAGDKRRKFQLKVNLEELINSYKNWELQVPGRITLTQEAAIFNVARTVARRAESLYWKYLEDSKLEYPLIGAYLNRLSDYLYVRKASCR